jgi:hypothetical protein
MSVGNIFSTDFKSNMHQIISNMLLQPMPACCVRVYHFSALSLHCFGSCMNKQNVKMKGVP